MTRQERIADAVGRWIDALIAVTILLAVFALAGLAGQLGSVLL